MGCVDGDGDMGLNILKVLKWMSWSHFSLNLNNRHSFGKLASLSLRWCVSFYAEVCLSRVVSNRRHLRKTVFLSIKSDLDWLKLPPFHDKISHSNQTYTYRKLQWIAISINGTCLRQHKGFSGTCKRRHLRTFLFFQFPVSLPQVVNS